LFAGRADGLHLSEDMGETFEQVLDVAVTSLTELNSPAMYVAGTADGVRFSTKAMGGYVWIDAEDGTEGVHIYDLMSDSTGVYAATSIGLMFAADAQTWRVRLETDEPALSILADPDWDGGLWFSTSGSLYRSDDAGRTATEAPGAPVHGVVALRRVGPGHVLASGSDGPWESLDGGIHWLPVVRGLSDPACRGMASHKALLMLASDEGLFRIQPIRGEDKPGDGPLANIGLAAPELAWIDVQPLIDSSLARDGVATPALGGRIGRYLAPTLTIRGQMSPYRRTYIGGSSDDIVSLPGADLFGDATDTYSGGLAADSTTRLRSQMKFALYTELRWTPPGKSSAASSSITVDVDADGDIFVDDGQSPQMLAARVTRRVTEYRNSLALQVTDLYFARQQLLLETGELHTASLLDQVQFRLQVAEIEARLDYLTDGAVSRYDAALLREDNG
jgi:hypothetical protein